MYGKDPNNTAIIRAVVPNDTDTLSFDSDGGEGEFAVPARHEKGSLEDTWRIDPQHLQCRRRSNGELYKLGAGKCPQAELNVLDLAMKLVRHLPAFPTVNCNIYKK
jgi:hypothetical protein